jgi:ATP-dependent DNA helicase DinG
MKKGSTSMMKYAVLDFETTGNQPEDVPIQVGLVVINEDLTVQDTYHSFIKANIPVPPFIAQLTGIDDSMLIDAPPMEQVLAEMLPLLEGTTLVGHNIGFDLAYLQKALDDNGYHPFAGRVLDTVDFSRILFPTMPSYQLTSLSAALQLPHERPHRADSDAEATASLWLKCLDKLNHLPLITIQRLQAVTQPLRSDLAWFLDWFCTQREMRTVLDEDQHRYFRQFALQTGEWQEEKPARSEDEPNPLTELSFDQFYAEIKESLKKQFAQFEDRASQEQMLNEVLGSFENGQHLLIEAGTGTGKSLGYLIPALYYGIRNEKKVVVSTHTINLQEQLYKRDIPLLESSVPVHFRAAVLKGRNHYLCLRKFENKINAFDYPLERDSVITAAQLVVWLSETVRGDDEELHLGASGTDFWTSVASDADSCLNRACPWFKRCFYHRARYEANISDLIITNHSMLLTDVKAEHRLLPAYDYLIVDEAHHLEEVAGKHLGLHFQYFTLHHILTRLLKDSRTGQLPSLASYLSRLQDESSLEQAQVIEGLYPKLVKIKEEWDTLTDLLYQRLTEHSPPQNDSGQYVYRLQADQFPPSWEQIRAAETNLFVEISDVVKTWERLALELKDEHDDLEWQSLFTDLNGTMKEFNQLKDDLRFILNAEQQNYVYWLEASTHYRSKSLQFNAIPIDVSDRLNEFFFSAKESAILTSATLTVGKNFNYVCEQLGLTESAENGKLRTVQLPSPFEYRKQALVCIPRDFPGLKGHGAEERFIATLVESLKEVALEMGGKTMVLFTSYRMLKQTYEPLKELLSPHGIQVLGQGIDSGNRSKLTRWFRDSQGAVLLGTSSYWEGVDIPGEALSCLAIVRLPFQPPNHPLIQAKSEQLERQKQNPFLKLSVPQAVIRFKQGFGRLVRTASDKGIVIIYDTRVIDTYYGKHFLYSLPGPKIEHMNLKHLVPRMKEWLETE